MYFTDWTHRLDSGKLQETHLQTSNLTLHGKKKAVSKIGQTAISVILCNLTAILCSDI